MNDETKALTIETEPATPHLSTIHLPFGDEAVFILWEWDPTIPEGMTRPVGLIMNKKIQEQLYQALRDWRQGRKHRLLGNTCPSCGKDIDDRAKACLEHRVKSPGRGRRRLPEQEGQ